MLKGPQSYLLSDLIVPCLGGFKRVKVGVGVGVGVGVRVRVGVRSVI